MIFAARLIKLCRFVFYTGLILLSIACMLGMFAVFIISKDLPKLPHPLSRIIETPQSQIFASNGQVLLTLGERRTVPLNMVSQDFLNAILAIEDHRFFEHHGINKLRTIKGLYVTLFERGRVQGASTITQQLAKNMFFSFEQTYNRKFKELLVSFQIEASNTKEEILHAYINQIHFGAGAQGIERASQVFFGKAALDLKLSEAALLAGLPKSPTNYNPFRFYDRAVKRRNIVLSRMAQAGFITPQESQQAMQESPELNMSRKDARTGSYFVDELIKQLVHKYGEDVVYHGGIKAYATIDPRLQAFAEAAVVQGLQNLDGLIGLDDTDEDRPQGALVSIDVGSGAVKALVGGRNYYQSEYNRASSARRQPGSGFKPFLYYTAFRNLGYHPGTVMTDLPVKIRLDKNNDWSPQNFTMGYSGEMILKQALTLSINTIAAQLVEITGPGPVVQTAKACGIKSPLSEVYSIALGTSEVTPLEMASAYAVFAGLGVMHEPFFFWRVEDAFGRILDEHIVRDKIVLDEAIAYQVVDMMKSVVDNGSGKIIRKMGFDRQAAGKTGTSDNFTDAWFTGFTPTLCTSVWTGYDQKKKLVDRNRRGITGGRGAAPIWAHFMIQAHKALPERDFPIPKDIRFDTVEVVSGCSTLEQDQAVSVMAVPLKSNQEPCEKAGFQ